MFTQKIKWVRKADNEMSQPCNVVLRIVVSKTQSLFVDFIPQIFPLLLYPGPAR